MRVIANPEMKGPDKCLLKKHFTVIPVCASCDQAYKCEPYLELYRNKRKEIIEIILKYIEEHKEKYEIGVIFMAEKKAKPRVKLFVALMDGKVIATGTQQEIEGIIKEDPKRYSGKITLFPATGAKEAVITLSLKDAHFTKATLSKVGDRDVT